MQAVKTRQAHVVYYKKQKASITPAFCKDIKMLYYMKVMLTKNVLLEQFLQTQVHFLMLSLPLIHLIQCLHHKELHIELLTNAF